MASKAIGLSKEEIRRMVLDKLRVVYRNWNCHDLPFCDLFGAPGERRDDPRAFVIALVAALLGGISEAMEQNNQMLRGGAAGASEAGLAPRTASTPAMREGAMWKRIEAGAVAGLVAALLVDGVMFGRTVAGLDGRSLSALTVVAEAAHAHGALAGGLIALGYGGVIGAFFGWLAHRQRLTELSGVFWGILYGVSWAIVSGLVVVPLLQGVMPFGAAALTLMAPSLFGSGVGHVLYGAMLGAAFVVITNHVIRPRDEEQQQPAERRAA